MAIGVCFRSASFVDTSYFIGLVSVGWSWWGLGDCGHDTIICTYVFSDVILGLYWCRGGVVYCGTVGVRQIFLTQSACVLKDVTARVRDS